MSGEVMHQTRLESAPRRLFWRLSRGAQLALGSVTWCNHLQINTVGCWGKDVDISFEDGDIYGAYLRIFNNTTLVLNHYYFSTKTGAQSPSMLLFSSSCRRPSQKMLFRFTEDVSWITSLRMWLLFLTNALNQTLLLLSFVLFFTKIGSRNRPQL